MKIISQILSGLKKLINSIIGLIKKIFPRLNLSLLNNISIRYKLVGFFLLVSVIPIAIIGLVSYFNFTGAIRNKIMQYSLQGMWQKASTLKQSFSGYENIGLQVTSEISDLVTAKDPATLSDRKQKVVAYLKRYCEEDPNIKIVYFLSNDGKADLDTGNAEQFSFTNEDLRKSKIYETILNYQGIVVWGTTEGLSNVAKDFVVGRVIRDSKTFENLGVLLEIVNEEGLNTILNPTYQRVLVNDNYYIMLDSTGKVLISPLTEQLGRNAISLIKNSELLQETLSGMVRNQTDFIGKINSTEVLVTFLSIDKQHGWYLLNIAPTNALFKEARNVGWIALILGLIFTILAIAISLYVAGNISNPIVQIANAMKLAENGDLTTRFNITRHDEFEYLGISFNRMLNQISQLIIDTQTIVNKTLDQSATLEEGSIQSVRTAENISAAMTDISKGTLEQTNEAELVSRKMSELADNIDEVVVGAATVELITDTTKVLSNKSKETIANLISKANQSRQITNTIIRDVEDMNDSAVEIGKITDIIADIAEKTNLLALNAAIEAARAGEAGRGFAVVAKEVNSLAAQSQHAAQTIEDLLQVIKAKTGSSAKNADQAHLIVQEQAEAVKMAEKTFDEIVKSMDDAIVKMTEMSSLVQRLTIYKEHTIQSIINISAVSEETAAAAQEVTAASEEQTAVATLVKNSSVELRTMAENLVELTDKFKVNASKIQ